MGKSNRCQLSRWWKFSTNTDKVQSLGGRKTLCCSGRSISFQMDIEVKIWICKCDQNMNVNNQEGILYHSIISNLVYNRCGKNLKTVTTAQTNSHIMTMWSHTSYLSFFLTQAKFLENKIYTEKTRKLRQNTQ